MLSRLFFIAGVLALTRAGDEHESRGSHESLDTHMNAMMKKRSDDDSDPPSTTSTVPHTTLKEADDGVVDGECHNLGLHGNCEKRATR
jgi:hypothetical protein